MVTYRHLPSEKPFWDFSADAKKKGLCLGVCNLVIITVVFIIPCARHIRESISENAVESFLEEVLRRCLDYSPPPDAPLRVNKECEKIAEAFRDAVASKDPCNITAKDYQPLMELVNQQNFPCNKVLLWSKTEELKNDYKEHGGKLLTLGEMLVGHIARNLTWCRDKKSSEVNHGPFQEMKGICHDGPKRVFWEVAAKWFAENACEKVQVLLNGTSNESVAYNETSVFATAEVGNLSSAVTKLHAWVIYDRGVNVSDSCSGASINILKSRLQEKNITFTCEHTDREAFLQSVKNRGVSQCKSVLRDSGVIGLIVALLLSINLPDSGATLVGS